MENTNIKVRINLTQREIELEGDRDFILENFGVDINEYITMIKAQPVKQVNVEHSKTFMPEMPVSASTQVMPDSFGEYYNKFPNSLSNVDKILLAGYYLQNTLSVKSFTIQQASDLLIDQGVKLSNANAFNTANISTKRVFKFSGKDFKVSETGVEYIKTLTSK